MMRRTMMSKSRKEAPTQTKHLRKDQFLKLWYKNMPCSIKTIENHMEDIYVGLVTTIYNEMCQYGQIKLPDIGVFYRSEQGGYEITHPDMHNPDVEVTDYIPVVNVVRFRSAKNFKRIINGQPLKKKFKAKSGRYLRKKDTEYAEYLANNKELQDRADIKMLEDLDKLFAQKKESGGNMAKLIKENPAKYSFGRDVDWFDDEDLEDETTED